MVTMVHASMYIFAATALLILFQELRKDSVQQASSINSRASSVNQQYSGIAYRKTDDSKKQL
jgi:hypothetical protein